jgi:epoxyqueuosine reductase
MFKYGITYSKLIKAEAKRLGFFTCGISKARFLNEEAERFETWLKKGMNASMTYLENNIEQRLDPTLLVPGAKSIISVLLNYYPQQTQMDKKAPIVSKYAYGEDYHFVMKAKLNDLLNRIQQTIGTVDGKVFVDSAPVLEKKWAELSGLVWRGKHSMMLTRQGSFCFIGEIIIDLETEYDQPIKSSCGKCRLCIDACPTGAILEPYILDSGKCISYFTIEHKETIPEKLRGLFENRLFGCDICQDVCPYNKKPMFHNEDSFNPQPGFLEMSKEDWFTMSETVFKEQFGKSAIKRGGLKGLKRNLDFLKS